ncbi:MAG: hypothetical protein ACI3ZL_09900 [Candidatus Cryptobacteroides sp.]
MYRLMESRTVLARLMLLPLIAGLASCVNEAYDVENLNTEITVAQSGLALPLGSTKQLTVKELLKDLDEDVLSVLDGGYAIRMSDKLNLAENLPNMKELLQIDDISVDESFEFAIESFDQDDLTIEEQSFNQEIGTGSSLDTDIPAPAFSSSETIALGMYEYAQKIKNIDLSSGFQDATVSSKVKFSLPPVIGSGSDAEIPFPDTDPKAMDKTSADFEIKFSSPDNEGKITRICDLKMARGSKMVLTAKISGYEFITKGDVITNLDIDFGGLLGFEDGSDVIALTDETFNSANNFTIAKEFSLSAINIDADNWKGTEFSQNVTLAVDGTLAIKNATTTTNTIKNYTGDGVKIDVTATFSGLSVASATMDISNVTVKETVNVPISLGDDGIELPDHVKSIDRIAFDEDSKLGLSIYLTGLDKTSPLNINGSLEFAFPEKITVENGRTQSGTFKFTDIDLKTDGFNEVFKVKGITLPAPEGGFIKWSDNLVVTTQTQVSGTGINSADFPARKELDYKVETKADASLTVKDWEATVEDFEVEFDAVKESFSMDVDGSIANYGTLTVHPEGTPTVSISLAMPQLESLGIVAGSKNVSIAFPKFIKFKNITSSYNYDQASNSISFMAGEKIPETISLDIDKLVLNPEKKEGSDKYQISGEFCVSGNIGIKGGTISEKDAQAVSEGISISATIPEITASTLEVNEFKMDIDEAFRATLIKGDQLPDDIKILELSDVLLDNTTATFDISISGLPDFGKDKDVNIELVIDLPKELVLAEDSRVEGNILTIKGTLDSKDGTIDIAPIKVAAIDLSDYDFDKKEDLVEKISVKGKFSIDNPNIDLSTVTGTVKADIKAGVKNIAFKKVSGRIDYQIDPTSQTVSLGDIPDMLKDENFNLDFDNPYIILKARTNLGIPLKGDVSIIPVRNGADDNDGAIEFGLNIDGAPSAADKDSVMYFIGAKNDGCPANYTFIETPNIRKMLSRIPDDLKIGFNAGTDSSKECMIEPTADYMFDVEYEFVCPLSFGEDLHIEISDTITGLDKTISNILKNNTIQLGGQITNSLPLGLELNVELLDEDNGVIRTKTPASQAISSCSSNGEASVSPLELKLETDLDDSQTISSIKLSFTVTSGNVTGMVVKEDMFVQADLKLLLPEGITIDLEDMN